MGSTFGKVFRVSTFGGSHGKVVEAIVDGCPAGSELEEGIVPKQLDRRKPGQSKITKNRSKADTIEILSRLFGAKPLGTSIGLLVKNKDARPTSHNRVKELCRPGACRFHL